MTPRGPATVPDLCSPVPAAGGAAGTGEGDHGRAYFDFR
jgi:hypothetical protein